MSKIAIIGTGIMGHGMAANFLKQNYQVYVWNRSAEKVKELVSAGATLAKTPQQATQSADLIFEVTANDESSRQVWLERDGILAGADKNKMLITSATLSISWVDELAQMCADRKLSFFDMPLTGGRIGAETGQLTLLVGGDEKKLRKIMPTLSAISTNVIYFGPAGSGMRYKLVLNMTQAIHVAALGEALRLAKELGLDINKVGNALSERPGGVITNLAWRDYQVEPHPINFSVEWITKDLTYAKQAAKESDTALLTEVLKRYRRANKLKLGQKDWTAINKLD